MRGTEDDARGIILSHQTTHDDRTNILMFSPSPGKRDTGMGIRVGDTYYSSEELTFSADKIE